MKYLLPVLLFPIAVFSQLNNKTLLPNILPPNPQAFQFMKYGDIPIGKYSGTPEINLPLYTIKTKGLDIPVSLSYSSNGVKVSEEAGNVGLGWSLNAGGSIVQAVIGTDDYGHYRRRITPDYACMINYQSPVPITTLYAGDTPFFLGEENKPTYLAFRQCLFANEYVNGTYDTTPDKFTFSFLNYSGEFFLDWQTGQFKCLTDKNIKIIPDVTDSYALPNYFVIVTPDGNRFRFQLKEETKALWHYTTNETGAVASLIDIRQDPEKMSRVYKLVSIVTKNAETVSFNYSQTAESKNLPSISQTTSRYQQIIPSGMIEAPFKDEEVTSRLGTAQSYAYLTSITFDSGRINFISSDRLDLKEAKKLDKIEVRNTMNTLIKGITFSTSYFQSNTQGATWDNYLAESSYNPGKTADELTKRLRLDSIQESGSNPYKFTYNSQTLPKKTSYATDYWGYYNGYLNNTSFVPNPYRFNLERDDTFYLRYQNNNKSPNVDYCKAGILEQLTYPTGGYTFFEWELNTFTNFAVPPATQGQLKTVSISTVPGSSSSGSTKTIMIEGGNTIITANALLSTRGCTDPEAFSNCYVKMEKFSSALVTLIKSNSTYLQHYSTYGIDYVLNVDLHLFTNQALYNQYIENVTSLQKTYSDPQEKLYSNLIYNFTPGIVVFSVHGGCGTYNGTVNSSQATIGLSYRDYVPLSGLSAGGGLRVKSVVSYSSNGYLSAAGKKTYSYEGGKLMSPLTFFNKTNYRHSWSHIYQVDDDEQLEDILNFVGYKKELSSNSFISQSMSAMGHYVGYDKVTETEIAVDQTAEPKGTVTEWYVNQAHTGGSTGAGEFAAISLPEAIQSPSNGLLLTKEIKNKAGYLLEKETYGYDRLVNDKTWAMKAIEHGNWYEMVFETVYYYPKYLIGFYPIMQVTTVPSSVTTEHYSYDTANNPTVMSERKEMEYDSYNQLAYEKKINSKNDVIETFYSHPYDISGGDPQYATAQQMLASYVIAPVIKSTTKVNSEPASTSGNNYYLSHGTNGFALPSTFFLNSTTTQKGSESTGYTINYGMNDYIGNPGEISTEGRKVCYLWGYNRQYPIAKIENIGYLDIPPGLISAAVNASNLTDINAENTLLVALNNLRSAPELSNALITTYTYKPLTGISTVTNPNGSRLYYTYDLYGRLLNVKDNDQAILSQNAYHYKP